MILLKADLLSGEAEGGRGLGAGTACVAVAVTRKDAEWYACRVGVSSGPIRVERRRYWTSGRHNGGLA